MDKSLSKIMTITKFRAINLKLFPANIIISFIIFVIIVSTLQAHNADSIKFSITIPKSTSPIKIQAEGTYIESKWTAPQTNLAELEDNEWRHENRKEYAKVLAGRAGTLISDVFTAPNLTLIREVWISKDTMDLAIRQKVWNRGSADIHLNAIIPIYCNGPQSLVISGEQDGKNWQILIQQRLKNGRPQVITPSQGARHEIDPFVLFHRKAKEESPTLLIGYISQTGHCARMWLQFDEMHDSTLLNHFITQCEFDNVLIPPGGERSSQWILIKMGSDPNKLVADYADRVGVYHGIPEPPKNAPSVFCSWYFHGYHYNETFFHEDLAALKKDPIPFDVFLIDECWSLNKWGDFEAIDSWPNGMKNATDRIRALGYKPGIWSCPYLVDFTTDLAKNHPEWLLKNEMGERITFRMNNMDHWVLDLTFPGVCDFLEEAYRKLAHDWGFEYFKFDFMRAVFLEKGQKFYDPTKTRLEAYRMGLEAIRRGTGSEVYISVCGGHYGGSLGIANSQRSGSDVVSIWRAKEIPKFRQNILRTWMSRLWHVDPDAMMVRKRAQRFHPDKELSLGLLSDDEARTIALNQYIGGGLITFTEFMPELGAERRTLYRHVIPSVNSSAIPLDIFDPVCPSILLTKINPKCPDLEPWVTVALINWSDEKQNFSLQISQNVVESLHNNHFLVFEFFSQKVLGIFTIDNVIELRDVKPHSSRLLRIISWGGNNPVLVGTDLHFSGGAVEIAAWHIRDQHIEGEINTPWKYPLKLNVAVPAENQTGYIQKSVVVEAGQRFFKLDFPEQRL